MYASLVSLRVYGYYVCSISTTRVKSFRRVQRIRYRCALVHVHLHSIVYVGNAAAVPDVDCQFNPRKNYIPSAMHYMRVFHGVYAVRVIRFTMQSEFITTFCEPVCNVTIKHMHRLLSRVYGIESGRS